PSRFSTAGRGDQTHPGSSIIRRQVPLRAPTPLHFHRSCGSSRSERQQPRLLRRDPADAAFLYGIGTPAHRGTRWSMCRYRRYRSDNPDNPCGCAPRAWSTQRRGSSVDSWFDGTSRFLSDCDGNGYMAEPHSILAGSAPSLSNPMVIGVRERMACMDLLLIL